MKERTGSIVKRRNEKLYARIIYKGEDEERHDITRLATDRKDARRIIKEILNDLEERGKKAISADRMKFSEAVDFYRDKKAIPPVIRNGRRVAGLKSWYTLRIYLDALNAYFSEMRLRDIKAADLEEASLKFRVSRIGNAMTVFLVLLQRMGEDEKKPGPDFSLGGNLEEALHESNLSANVAFPDPFNLLG